ncbi:MAG: hypothetical protein OHK0015_44430 [Chloroflexi bacterium OHK40]
MIEQRAETVSEEYHKDDEAASGTHRLFVEQQYLQRERGAERWVLRRKADALVQERIQRWGDGSGLPTRGSGSHSSATARQ